MSSNPANDLPLAQKAASILKKNHSGTLSTQSVKHEGYPFPSLANYCTDANGQPVFFFSSMATHSKNLRANSKAALLVAQSDEVDGVLAGSRLTLMGNVVPIESSAADLDDIRDTYLQANPDARQWISFGDFQFYRLELVDIYFVAGFGAMGWITPEEFKTAHE